MPDQRDPTEPLEEFPPPEEPAAEKAPPEIEEYVEFWAEEPPLEPIDAEGAPPQEPVIEETGAPRPQPPSEPEPEALPSIEELTFQARAPQGAAAVPAPQPPLEAPPLEEIVRVPPPPQPRPFAPHTLSRRRAATLAAFADALIPRGGPVPEAASDVRVAERLDAILAEHDPRARRSIERFLTFFEWQSLFSRALRPFSRLKPEVRAQAIDRAMRSRLMLRRGAVDLLKFYCLNQYASSPQVEARIGFTYGCVTSDPPRDGERLEVIGFPQVDRDHVEECDVVVVGSGAGGSVVAKEMAELGLSVVVVEEGGYYTRQDFTGPPFERFLRMYRRNGQTAAFGRPTIPLPMGMAVGGSTVVNSGTCFRTPDRVLLRWEREFGIPQIEPETMRPFFDRIERIQRVQPVPEELLGNNARVFRRGVQKLGLHGEPIRRTIDGCRGCGVCAFGCPSDAKLSMHLTYLPRAQKAGTTIYGNARVERILVDDGRARGVVARLLDPRTREPMATLSVRAKLTVLAAGAIHTPALLGANALGNASGQLGRNLRIHPAAGVGALFEEEVYGWRGTLQSFYVDDWHESHDVMIEVTSSIPSIGAGTFPGSGLALKELLGRYPHLATAGLFVSDTSVGRIVRRARNEPLALYRLNRNDTRRLVRGIANTAEIFLAAGARAVLTGIPGVGPVTASAQLQQIDEEGVAPGSLRLTAFHPVGTARMGSDPSASVVDPWGAVHGVANLFVSDASTLPGCPTVNPQITIMAFATRAADHIARHASRYF